MSPWLTGWRIRTTCAVRNLYSWNREAYGAAIRQLIEQRAGRSVSSGALYTTLDRLEQRGLLASTWGEPTAERGGKRKRTTSSSPPDVKCSRARGKPCGRCARRRAETGAIVTHRPPRLASWALDRLLDPDAAEAIGGDLAEEFGRRASTDGAYSLTPGRCPGREHRAPAAASHTACDLLRAPSPAELEHLHGSTQAGFAVRASHNPARAGLFRDRDPHAGRRHWRRDCDWHRGRSRAGRNGAVP